MATTTVALLHNDAASYAAWIRQQGWRIISVRRRDERFTLITFRKDN